MFDEDKARAAILSDDLGEVTEQIKFLIASKGQGAKPNFIYSKLEQGLVFTIENDRASSFDLILAANPPSQNKLDAIKTAIVLRRMDFFHKLAASGMRPQDLIEAAMFSIRAREPAALAALFNQYGVDPETKIKLYKKSAGTVSFYEYAAAHASTYGLVDMERHVAVLGVIVEALKSKSVSVRAQLAATAGAAGKVLDSAPALA